MRAARVGLKAGAAGGAAEADMWAVHVSVKARGFVSLSAVRWAAGRGERKGAGRGVGRRGGNGPALGWCGRGRREKLAGPELGSLGRFFGFCFYFLFLFLLYFLFLNQTKFEFKYNLNSNHTQIIETMHQHECNTRI